MAEQHIAPSGRLTKANIDYFIRKKIAPIFRKSVLLAAYRSRGRMQYNKTGYLVKWRPRYRRLTLTAGDSIIGSHTFTRDNLWTEANLPWRRYHMGQAFDEFEKLANRGEARFFPLVLDTVAAMVEDWNEDLRLRLYYDGYSTSTPNDIHGWESPMGHDGTLLTGVPVMNCNDTYGGISTALAGSGGSWSPPSGKAWPEGTGDAEYPFWTPMILDYNNPLFGGDTWKENWEAVFNYGESYINRLQGEKPNLWLLDTELVRQIKDDLNSITTLEVTQKSDLTDMGFVTIKYNGVEIADEYGVPANEGYGLNLNRASIWSMYPQLYQKVSDDDITTSSELILLRGFVQHVIEAPSYHIKLEAHSTAGS